MEGEVLSFGIFRKETYIQNLCNFSNMLENGLKICLHVFEQKAFHIHLKRIYMASYERKC